MRIFNQTLQQPDSEFSLQRSKHSGRKHDLNHYALKNLELRFDSSDERDSGHRKRDVSYATYNHLPSDFLHWAAQGKLEDMRHLIERIEEGRKKDYLYARDYRRKTPLHLAAEGGHGDVVVFLVNEGVDPTITDDDGKMPIHMAVVFDHRDIAKFLIEEMGNHNGRNFVHYAAEVGNIGLVGCLIKEDPNLLVIPDNHGFTPLHLAAEEGRLDVVKYLVDEKKVDLNQKDNYGLTPLHLAAEKGQLDIVKYLVDEKS